MADKTETFRGRFPAGPAYNSLVSVAPTWWQSFFSQTSSEWQMTAAVAGAGFVFGVALAPKLGLKYLTQARAGLYLGSTSAILGVHFGTVRSAERLLGYHENGAGLRQGFEGFDKWANVPAPIKQQ